MRKKEMNVSDKNALTLPQQHSSNIVELNALEWKIEKNRECIVTDDGEIQISNASAMKNIPVESMVEEQESEETICIQLADSILSEQKTGHGKQLAEGTSSTEQGTGVQAVENHVEKQQHTDIQVGESILAEQETGHGKQLAEGTSSTEQGIGMRVVDILEEQGTTDMHINENILAEQKIDYGKLAEGMNSAEQGTGMQAVESLVEEQETSCIQFAENILANQETDLLAEGTNLEEQAMVGPIAVQGQGIDIQYKERFQGQKTGVIIAGNSSEMKTGITVEHPQQSHDLSREEFKEILRLEQYLEEFNESDEEETEPGNRTEQKINLDDFEEILLEVIKFLCLLSYFCKVASYPGLSIVNMQTRGGRKRSAKGLTGQMRRRFVISPLARSTIPTRLYRSLGFTYV